MCIFREGFVTKITTSTPTTTDREAHKDHVSGFCFNFVKMGWVGGYRDSF